MADRRSEIRNIIIVLFTSVVTACLIAAFFVLNYGPSGRYALEAVLIEPSLLSHLDYNDNNPHISNTDRYIFDKIVWLDSDYSSKQISTEVYKKIYALLKSDQSTSDPNQRTFSSRVSPKLALWVKTESPSSWQKDAKIFQEIEFQKDHYRVSLHAASPEIAFAYFSHPDILESIQKLLNE